jgi:hypothetical protein
MNARESKDYLLRYVVVINCVPLSGKWAACNLRAGICTRKKICDGYRHSVQTDIKYLIFNIYALCTDYFSYSFSGECQVHEPGIEPHTGGRRQREKRCTSHLVDVRIPPLLFKLAREDIHCLLILPDLSSSRVIQPVIRLSTSMFPVPCSLFPAPRVVAWPSSLTSWTSCTLGRTITDARPQPNGVNGSYCLIFGCRHRNLRFRSILGGCRLDCAKVVRPIHLRLDLWRVACALCQVQDMGR